MIAFAAMITGPVAAFLVESFPARVRYTSMSLPYHFGNGWFGGFLPLIATALVARTGNIYAGLAYPIGDCVDDVHHRVDHPPGDQAQQDLGRGLGLTPSLPSGNLRLTLSPNCAAYIG